MPRTGSKLNMVDGCNIGLNRKSSSWTTFISHWRPNIRFCLRTILSATFWNTGDHFQTQWLATVVCWKHFSF